MALLSLDIDPSRRQLRQFAGIWFPAFFALVGFLGIYWDWWTFPSVMPIGIAVVTISLIGVIVPGFIRPVFFGMMYAVYPIGLVISSILVAAIYYLVITPIGVLVRTIGSDPMTRKLDSSASSYWIEKQTNNDMQSYLRQF